MYEQITVVVEGALAEEEEFADYNLRNAYLKDLRAEAEAEGFRAEVFVIEHPHEPDAEDCACSQFSTDHRPRFVFPEDDAPTGW